MKNRQSLKILESSPSGPRSAGKERFVSPFDFEVPSPVKGRLSTEVSPIIPQWFGIATNSVTD